MTLVRVCASAPASCARLPPAGVVRGGSGVELKRRDAIDEWLEVVDENHLQADKSNICICNYVYIYGIDTVLMYIRNSRATCKWIVRSGSCVYSRLNHMMLQRSDCWQDTLAMYWNWWSLVILWWLMRSPRQNQCLVMLYIFCFNMNSKKILSLRGRF